MRLAKGVATRNQGYSLFIVHRHARECFAHIAARCHGVGVAVRALWVHIDQAHLHGGQGLR